MTTTFRIFALEKLFKNNPSAHSLYMQILEDCDEEGFVSYCFQDLYYKRLNRSQVRENLEELRLENFIEYKEGHRCFDIKVVSDE